MIHSFRESGRVVVTASFEKLGLQFSDTTEKGKVKANELVKYMNSPEFQKAVRKNGRDGLVLLDGALKHPVVVTGVSKFARSKGIPYTDALLRLASLGLAKILKAIPERLRLRTMGRHLRRLMHRSWSRAVLLRRLRRRRMWGSWRMISPSQRLKAK